MEANLVSKEKSENAGWETFLKKQTEIPNQMTKSVIQEDFLLDSAVN